PMREAGAAPISPNSNKRPAPGAAPEASKRHRPSLDARSSIGPEGTSTTRRMQALTIHEPEDDDLSSLSSVPDTDEEGSDFQYEEAGETADTGARRAGAHASATRGRSDEQIIAQLPAGIWARAKAAANAPGLPVGVNRKSNKFTVTVRLDGKYKALGSFSIKADRDEIMAKALAIATRLAAEEQGGISLKTKVDADVIAKFSPDLWERAQTIARAPGLPTGVTRNGNRFIARIQSADRQKTLISNFSITAKRDEAMAKALAIATRLDAEVREGGGRRQDAAVIAGFAPEIWARAQEAAKAPGLPTGVSRYGDMVVARMTINKVYKTLGAFAITADRNEVTARALAIAARWTAERDREQK
uniref:hypothetical protein n=1 Tax=Pseudomonas sp. GL-B-16 TaxID=2832373 RepID=UPI001CBE64D1